MNAAFGPLDQETYCFYLVPGFSAMGFVAAMEPLRVANRLAQRAVFAWRLFSADGAPVEASCGLKVAVDGPLDETATALIVCAGFEPRRGITRPLIAALRRMTRKGTVLGAIDTGVYLLAEAGLIGFFMLDQCSMVGDGRRSAATSAGEIGGLSSLPKWVRI